MSGIPIRGTARGSAGAAFTIAKRRGAQRLDFTRDYLVSLYAVCATLGINADVLVAQWSEETGDGTSAYWLNDGNPAGIAAFDDGSNWGLTFTPETAAGGQAVHMCRYLGMTVSAELQKLDARWQAVADAGYVGRVTTTADLGNGLWATNPSYAKNLLERYTAYWGEYTDAIPVPTPSKETPVSDTAPKKITFGKVPKFGYTDRQSQTADKPEGVGWDNLGKRNPKAVVLHRMVGSLTGTDSWFGSPSVGSLTDFGIGIKAQDGANYSKLIMQWNDPYGYRAGWASGPVNGAYGDGLAIVTKYGINAVNRDCISIEISGQYATPIADDEFEEIATFLAYFWDQMHIPYDKAPINPATGISAVLFHQEYTLGTGKICPGPVVMKAIDDLIARAVAIMKPYQAGTTAGEATTPPVVTVPEPTWSDPKPIVELATYTKADADSAPDGIQTPWGLAVWVNDDIEAIRDTTRRQEPKLDALYVGPTLKKGGTGHALWLITRPNGERWYYSDYYTCFPAADFKRTKD